MLTGNDEGAVGLAPAASSSGLNATNDIDSPQCSDQPLTQNQESKQI